MMIFLGTSAVWPSLCSEGASPRWPCLPRESASVGFRLGANRAQFPVPPSPFQSLKLLHFPSQELGACGRLRWGLPRPLPLFPWTFEIWSPFHHRTALAGSGRDVCPGLRSHLACFRAGGDSVCWGLLCYVWGLSLATCVLSESPSFLRGPFKGTLLSPLAGLSLSEGGPLLTSRWKPQVAVAWPRGHGQFPKLSLLHVPSERNSVGSPFSPLSPVGALWKQCQLSSPGVGEGSGLPRLNLGPFGPVDLSLTLRLRDWVPLGTRSRDSP